MSLVSPGHLVQNSLRNTMIQLMFLVVQSGHPDVQKGIKTRRCHDAQKTSGPDTPMFRRGLRLWLMCIGLNQPRASWLL